MFCSTEATVYMISSRLWGNTSPSVLCRRRSPHSPPWCRCMTSTRTKTLPGSRRPSKLKVSAQPATCWKFPHITVGVPPMKVYWDHTVWISGHELKHFTVGWIWTSRGSTLNSPLSLMLFLFSMKEPEVWFHPSQSDIRWLSGFSPLWAVQNIPACFLLRLEAD